VCCSVLQCVAACCSVLQRVAVSLQRASRCTQIDQYTHAWTLHVTVGHSVLRWLCCSALRCIAVCCVVLKCRAVCRSASQCSVSVSPNTSQCIAISLSHSEWERDGDTPVPASLLGPTWQSWVFYPKEMQRVYHIRHFFGVENSTLSCRTQETGWDRSLSISLSLSLHLFFTISSVYHILHQCVAVMYSVCVLQCVAVHCNLSVYRIVRQRLCVTVCCSVLQCAVASCSVSQSLPFLRLSHSASVSVPASHTQIAAYCTWRVISFFSNLNCWSRSQGLL